MLYDVQPNRYTDTTELYIPRSFEGTESAPDPDDESGDFSDILQGFREANQDTIETLQVSREAPWDKAGEDLLRSWLDAAKQQASAHNKTGYRLKRLYKIFGICSIVSASIVFLFSNITVTENEEGDAIFHVIVSFINLLVINLTSFLEFGPKYQLHFEFEGKFSKFGVDIEEILSCDPDFRAPKDRTLGEYKEKIGNLYTNSPEV